MKRSPRLPNRFKKYFWDCEFSELSLEKYPRFIAERILLYGNLQDIRWLASRVSKEMFQEIVLNSRRLDPKTKNFWKIYFGAN